MATGRVPTTANSPLTAKGDLFGYSTTQARVAVGSDGDTLVADSAATTGLRWQGNYAAGKNFGINGNFDIWQRGTSFTGSGYGPDRWYLVPQNMTISRQSTNAPIGSQYFARTTATSSSAANDFYMYFESSQIAPLLGRTITISIKVRRNATFDQNLYFRLDKSSTVDATSSASWTTITPTSGTDGTSNVTPYTNITTGTGASDWTTISRTIAIPNDGTANSLRVIVYYAATVPNGSVLDLAQFQMEMGSVVTTFSRAGGTIQGELAACQRYYWRTSGSGNYLAVGVWAVCQSATNANGSFINPVAMRTSATSVDYANLAVYDGTTVTAISAITLDDAGTTSQRLAITSTGMTQYRPYTVIRNNNSAGYLAFSAEL